MTASPDRIGNYELVQEIGRGDYTTIYQAHDSDFDRIIALKVMAPHIVWDDIFVSRFHTEFETVGQLRHPNIVTIYEYGEAEAALGTGHLRHSDRGRQP